MEKAVKFEVWKTLSIGGMSKDDLVKKLEENGFYITYTAKSIMSKFVFTTEQASREVQLVRIKVKDLGFTSETTTKELLSRAKERGLDLCPREVGLHLRLALTDQPRGDWFLVAVEFFRGYGPLGGMEVFLVGREGNGEQWLNTSFFFPNSRCPLEHWIVFCLRP